MSDEKHNKRTGEESEKGEPLADLVPSNSLATYLSVVFNKAANELVFKDPNTGTAIKVNAKMVDIEDEDDEEEDDDDFEPLPPEEFRTALKKIDDLGLTWTADRLPGLRPKEGVSDDVFASEELDRIQSDYPFLPREVGALIYHILSGREIPEEILGSKDEVEKKAAIVRESIISNDFRSEFFFKHAIKVPYLTEIDWEVVFKLREKSIKGIPGVCYALLSLEFHNPDVDIKSPHTHETLTVAVNDYLVNSLIETLTELRTQLKEAQETAKLFTDQPTQKGESHADNKRD
jgi:hypothetical protein